MGISRYSSRGHVLAAGPPGPGARKYGTMTDAPASDADPKPLPPEPPDLDACCGNGCDPCIFDLHDLAMDAYRQALRAWQARQPST